jgi:hypothetical protein
LSLSRKYQEKYEWTCEKVLFPSFFYLKNKDNPPKEAKKKIKPDPEQDKFIQKLRKSVLKNIPGAEIHLVSSNDVPEDIQKDEINSSTKVGGNELNAHTVIKFVVEASKILPDRTFYLVDDADALYCPLLIKNGLAKPDIDSINRSLKYWKDKQSVDTEIYKYYKKLADAEWGFTNINRFIRPLKVKAYLYKRKQVKTINFNKEQIDEIPSMMQDFIINERIEQMSYYDDIDSYPKEI